MFLMICICYEQLVKIRFWFPQPTPVMLKQCSYCWHIKMTHLTVFLSYLTLAGSRSIFTPPFYPPLVPQLYYSPPLPIVPRHHKPTNTFIPSDSINTLLGSLTKIKDVPEFTCTEEGTFPDPLDCSKYYHCDKDLQVRTNRDLWSLFSTSLNSSFEYYLDGFLLLSSVPGRV